MGEDDALRVTRCSRRVEDVGRTCRVCGGLDEAQTFQRFGPPHCAEVFQRLPLTRRLSFAQHNDVAQPWKSGTAAEFLPTWHQRIKSRYVVQVPVPVHGDQRNGVGLLHDVPEFSLAKQEVDRHTDRANHRDGELQSDKFRMVGHDHGDVFAGLDSELEQAAGEFCRPPADFGIRVRAAVGDHEWMVLVAVRRIAVMLGQGPRHPWRIPDVKRLATRRRVGENHRKPPVHCTPIRSDAASASHDSPSLSTRVFTVAKFCAWPTCSTSCTRI